MVMTRLLLIVPVLAISLATACASSSGSAAARGVVSGVVDSAPTCPVERIGSPCPPRPVPGAEVVALRGSKHVASTHTDGQGRFQLTLAYGHYTIRATNIGGLATTASKDVDVSAQPVSIELTVDSGIR
jgi:hypothetical protein